MIFIFTFVIKNVTFATSTQKTTNTAKSAPLHRITILINISCLPANFESSFHQVNSMLATNSVQKFVFNEPNEYITNYKRPISDIENLYTCLKTKNISLSNLTVTINDHQEIYDSAFYSSRYCNNTTIEFSLTVNNTYTLRSNIITTYQSGEGISIAICFAIAISGMCICCCICALICNSSNRVFPD